MSMTRPRSASPQPDTARKRGRIACIACRQAKVRCDLDTIPCSRCSRLDIDCSISPGFKRTNKRDKVNELEDNVQRIQSILEKQQTDTQQYLANPPLPTNGQNISPGGDSRNVGNSSTHQDSVSEARHLVSPNVRSLHDDSGMCSLGGIELREDEVGKIFAVFFERYHPFLPILDPEKTAIQYYDESTPLFWTIISIGLRVNNPELLLRLAEPLSVHLWTSIGTSTKDQVGKAASDVSEIQSLLLLATWSLPGVRLWSDRSFISASTALTSALHLGLHRPGFDAEYGRQPLSLDNRKTSERCAIWIACVCLCIGWALEFGHIPLVPSVDWLFQTVCSHNPKVQIPQELRHYAIIQRQINDGFQTLAQMDSDPSAITTSSLFFPHLAAFEKILVDIEEMYTGQLSLAIRLRSQSNLLLLQSMYFLSDYDLPESQQGVRRTYDTATRILTMLIDHEETTSFLGSAPHDVVRLIMRASFTLSRIVFSKHGLNVDRSAAKLLFNTALFLLRSMSLPGKQKDKPARVAEALKMTWNYMEANPSLREQLTTLKVRSRFGASLQYDCLIFYREAVKTGLDKKQKTNQQHDESTLTPASMVSNPTLGMEAPLSTGPNIYTPSFEDFMESDLTWIDSLVFPGLHSGL